MALLERFLDTIFIHSLIQILILFSLFVGSFDFVLEEELKKHSFTIKEGVEYRLKVLFK
jgi:hypothetical protein